MTSLDFSYRLASLLLISRTNRVLKIRVLTYLVLLYLTRISVPLVSSPSISFLSEALNGLLSVVILPSLRNCYASSRFKNSFFDK